ncbi:NifU family protein [Mycolicibacterium xanthum]|uniref:NifU family protein n=1 Tax=Mycolicibacterium xanthum TaxID=2796469 RepID=UPI00210275D7|nr:NifU family protein [Mycolicibacterium xanthum]
MVRLHPETTDDASTMRWITDATAPTDVAAELIADGTLAAVDVAPGQILTRLAPGHTWAADGPRVRTTLFQALSAAAPGDLQEPIARLLAREVGPYVASHGGELRVVSVDDGVVSVALEGTCGHCSLRSQTLTTMVAAAVRAEFPQIRSVRAVHA